MLTSKIQSKIEYVPQKVTMIDDKPAYLAGEWPGIKSSKWNGSIKVLNYVQSVSFKNPNYSLPNLGRKHFEEQRSKEYSNFATKKLIRYQAKEDRIEGQKKFPHIRRPSPVDIIRTKIKTPGKVEGDYNKFMPRKKIFYDNYKLTEREKELNNEMGSKKRLYSLDSRRNYLDVKSPGDKIYKNPDCCPDFFKEGGLVVGSSNTINYKKTQKRGNNNFYETLDLNVQTLNPNLLWDFKDKKEELDFQKNYVEKLNDWEKQTIGEIEDKGNQVISKQVQAPKKK